MKRDFLSYHTAWHPTPLGILEIRTSSEGIVSIRWSNRLRTAAKSSCPILQKCIEQLEDYFKGKITKFSLPLDWSRASEFDIQVWSALRNIPFGEKMTYSGLARQMGKPKGARAVGSANGRNPIAIIVPCHRLIGSDGQLRGYAYGLDRKEALLNHEEKFATKSNQVH